jgi:muramoyltetrapeptide carboxypeptidase LdcA involved in peptidoglycan recycling
MKNPPYLHPGDKIAIVCPAGYMPSQKATACIKTLKKWGYTVVKGKTLGGKSKNYFSGSPEERLADFQHHLNDPSVKAILCGRGGYGTTHLLDKIDLISVSKDGNHKSSIVHTIDGKTYDILSDYNYQILGLVQEEVHRFAINFHRKKESKKLFS